MRASMSSLISALDALNTLRNVKIKQPNLLGFQAWVYLRRQNSREE